MRIITLSYILAFVMFSYYIQSTKPIPPGLRDGDRAVQNGSVLEPPRESHNKSVNVDAVKAEASELQKLSDTIPGEADQISRGALPKDMVDNLKKIEKLAKHLRSEVSP